MSFAWHANRDGNSSDEDNIMLLPPAANSNPSTRLMDINDTESAPIQRRSVNNRNFHSSKDRMIQNAKDERKYKNSIVSILVLGVCLILMVNIGLGVHTCSSLEPDVKTKLPTKSVCLDETTKLKFPWQHYRLPTSLIPDSYHLHIHPNLTLQTYSASVSINLTVFKITKYIILHSRKHKFTSVTIQSLSNPSVTIKSIQVLHCKTYETVAFDFGFLFQKGVKYQLNLHFVGNLTFSLGGFYLSKFKKPDGTVKVIGTTQFESTDARAAFPCFDEPSFKAKFSLSMIRDPGMQTLFNMPLSGSNMLNNGLVMDVFPSTVKMSTYLVAFLVSDFKSITKKTANGVKVSVYSRSDKVNEIKFALDTAVDVLQYYEQLFNIPFPLPKMDLVAVPDFSAGAMENWGLVTYRETSLLYNPATSSVKDQEWVAYVIAHELSHQWFGNLVTMKWWNDLWLNEGFASYMEYAGVDNIKPNWKIMRDFIAKDVLRAMGTDSSRYTHPLSQPVTNSHQIEEMFDDISYEKGASMISMLIDYLGATFFAGVNSYLKKYSYNNADNHDFLLAMSEQDNNKHPNLLDMMRTWTVQPGFPLLKVSSKGSKVFVEQARFLFPTNESKNPMKQIWQIPLSYVTNKHPSTTKHYLLTKEKDSLQVGNFQWIKFNHDFKGFYKVSYDSSLWERLITQMNTDHTVFTASDRMSILSDAFSMAHLGKLKYSQLFSLLQYLKSEKSTPIDVALSNLGYIGSMIKFNMKFKEKKVFNSYVIDLFTPIYHDLAWKNKTDLNRMQSKLQSSVVSAMCRINYRPCVSIAYSKFLDWKNNNSSLIPGEMMTVFRTAIIYGVSSDWEYMWSYFVNSTDPNLKVKLLSTLAHSTNISHILLLQNELLKGVDIRSQSLTTVLRPMSTNVIGSMLLWRFLCSNWDHLSRTYPITGFAMRKIVRDCLNSMVSCGQEESAKLFFDSKGLGNVKSIKRSLEGSRINTYWSKTQLPTILQWLNHNQASWTSNKP